MGRYLSDMENRRELDFTRRDKEFTWVSEFIVSRVQILLVADCTEKISKQRPARHAGHEQLTARQAHLAVGKKSYEIFLTKMPEARVRF